MHLSSCISAHVHLRLNAFLLMLLTSIRLLTRIQNDPVLDPLWAMVRFLVVALVVLLYKPSSFEWVAAVIARRFC